MLTTVLTWLFLAACVSYVLLNLRLAVALHGMAWRQEEASRVEPVAEEKLPSVTVLVAARNEEVHLPRTLDALLAQDWPSDRLQVIVVDDRSEDRTPEILRDYAARHPGRLEHVRVDAVPPGTSPKKHALAQGLARARGTWIAVTDADCRMGPGWLRALARHFGDETGMVLGVTTYEEPARGFNPAEGGRALEFISYGVAAAGLTGLGFPMSANANNLAYRRAAFDAAGADAARRALVSGDDDFTLQAIHAAGWKIRFCPDRAARVRTQGPEDFRAFWEQRKRWVGKTIHYQPGPRTFLALLYLFYLSTALLLLCSLFRIGPPHFGLLAIAGLVAKTVGEFATMQAGLRLFGLSPLLRFFGIASALHLPLVVCVVPAGVFGRYTWKGQRMGRKA